MSLSMLQLSAFGSTTCLFLPGVGKPALDTFIKATSVQCIGECLALTGIVKANKIIRTVGESMSEAMICIVPGLVAEYAVRLIEKGLFEAENAEAIAYAIGLSVTCIRVGAYIYNFRAKRASTLSDCKSF